MPYLQFELDALKDAQSAAPVIGIPGPQAVGGLGLLWSWVFASKRDKVSTIQLEGFFATSSPRLTEALAAFGFVEPAEDLWRVKGAGRILASGDAVAARNSKGGLAAKGNLKQFMAQKSAADDPPAYEQAGEETTGLSTGLAPASDRPSSGLPPAYHRPLHQAPNTKHQTTKDSSHTSASPPVAGEVTELVALWNQTAHPDLPPGREGHRGAHQGGQGGAQTGPAARLAEDPRAAQRVALRARRGRPRVGRQLRLAPRPRRQRRLELPRAARGREGASAKAQGSRRPPARRGLRLDKPTHRESGDRMTDAELSRTVSEHLARCGVPRTLVSRLAEPLDVTPALESVQAWLDSGELTLVLGGAVGTGKTIAACFAFTQHRRKWDVFMYAPGDIPPDWRWCGGLFAPLADFQNRSLWDDEDRDFRDRAAATSLLVLDDVGSERGDGASAIQSLISSRMAAGRRTVITTNLPGEAFRVRYGARVLDRIRESGTFVNTGAKSLRGAA